MRIHIRAVFTGITILGQGPPAAMFVQDPKGPSAVPAWFVISVGVQSKPIQRKCLRRYRMLVLGCDSISRLILGAMQVGCNGKKFSLQLRKVIISVFEVWKVHRPAEWRSTQLGGLAGS